MKTTTKFIITILLVVMCGLSYAQTNIPDYHKDPKPNEKVLGTVTLKTEERHNTVCIGCSDGGYWIWDGSSGGHPMWKDHEVYRLILGKAQEEYPTKVVGIKNLEYTVGYRIVNGLYMFSANATAKVVYTPDPSSQFKEAISPAIEKAFRNVREGSRLAIDQVTVTNGINREETKDQLIDILLDKGYKVVAKEYLQKLYEEQQTQQSGIYNDKTTVQDNNFSAVGYFINVKVSETSVRVQVINVSTGEYEGNATIDF